MIDRLGEVYDAVCKGHDLHQAFRLVERRARVGLSPDAVASLTAVDTIILRHPDPRGQFFPLTVRALLAEMGETGPPRFAALRRPSSWESMWGSLTADEIYSTYRAAVSEITESK